MVVKVLFILKVRYNIYYMKELEIKYLKKDASNIDLDLIKKHFPKRYEEALKYKSEESRDLSILAGILIYNNLKIEESEIKYNKLKKPYIENGLYFNVSHSKDYVVFVKSEEKIGIDIEFINNKNMNIINYAYNEQEKEYILNGKDDYSKIERLTKLWTIKESLFKASGSEKYIEPKNISTIDIKNQNNIISKESYDYIQLNFLGETYNIYSIKFFDYIISVASITHYTDICFRCKQQQQFTRINH